ncbi:MAG: MSEP-CTERM sorting domain-containing protein [Flammeovirgaceae bacterium]
MRNLLSPKWILVVNTIPILILFTICFGTYTIIHTLLPEESLSLWKQYGISLAVIWQATLIFGVVRWSQKKTLNAWYSIFTFCTYIPFLYLYLHHGQAFVPSVVPRWMISEDFILYGYSFIMPTLLHALLVLVTALTPNESTKNPWFDFAVCIAVPITWYLVTIVLAPLVSNGYSGKWGEHALIVFTVVLTIGFLFFFSRGIYILYQNKLSNWKAYPLFWKIPVGIAFPIAGLVLNAELDHIFGDFNHPLFYILAVINGVLFCLPEAKNHKLRLAQYSLRAVLFPYIIYFFLVFIPFLPLSIIAILAVGAGFLMLTPLLLFVLQVKMLAADFEYLKKRIASLPLIALCVGCFGVLPLGVVISYQLDRTALHDALDYIYESGFDEPVNQQVDPVAIKRVLAQVRKNQDMSPNQDWFFSPNRETPYLTTYYNWLVLDNLSLSAQKIALLEKVYLGEIQEGFRASRWRRPSSEGVELTNTTVNSTYDPEMKAWRSWVEFELTNTDSIRAFTEYSTTFQLPVGTWISDYYLWIGDRKEPGILAEKKAATWIYNQITRTRRDPGILYYLEGNEVAFKVYPFIESEVRKTGIEFIHKEPVQFEVDGRLLRLGDDAPSPIEENQGIFENDLMVYVPANAKKNLPKVQRKPYLHFITDCSASQQQLMSSPEANTWLNRLGMTAQLAPAKVSLTNAYVETYAFADDWKLAYETLPFEGGFYLERALKQSLYEHTIKPTETYPVFVVISEQLEKAVWSREVAAFAQYHPEVTGFYHLSGDSVTFYRFDQSIMGEVVDFEAHMQANAVYAYPSADQPIAYLADSNEPALILKQHDFAFNEQLLQAKSWESALYLQGLWQSQQLHPEQGTARWREQVKGSFMAQIMTPVTSYIALENDAQKAMLKKKQEQALSGKKSLDLDTEDVNQMSEPEWWLLAVLLVMMWGIRTYVWPKISLFRGIKTLNKPK